MPKPTDDGKTYTFKIRTGVKFHDGTPLTAADVAASWNEITFPPEGVLSARGSNYRDLIEKIESPDAATVVFHLKFATAAFIPALADPFAYIYSKAQLDKDPHWYEKNVIGSGPFKFTEYESGPVDQGRPQPRLLHKGPALSRRISSAFLHRSRPPASTRSAATAPRWSSAACRPRPVTS